jgi:S-formylglutathione hydrolase FrmB
MALCTINLPAHNLIGRIDFNVLVPDYEQAAWAKTAQNLSCEQFYRSSKKYKVIWLLHGAGGDHFDWIRSTKLENYLYKHNLIAVLPNALCSDYTNYATYAGGFNFPQFLFHELMPLVYGWFPVSDLPEDNYIAGFSMGGNGALQLSLIHPEKFNAVGIFAGAVRDIDDLRPYRSMSSAEFRAEVHDTTRFKGTYPPGYNTKEINMIAKYPTVGDYLDSMENTWDRYLEAVENNRLPRLYVAVGSEDRCTMRVNKFKDLAKKEGDTKTIFTEIPGHNHTMDFSEIALCNFLDYFNI